LAVVIDHNVRPVQSSSRSAQIDLDRSFVMADIPGLHLRGATVLHRVMTFVWVKLRNSRRPAGIAPGLSARRAAKRWQHKGFRFAPHLGSQ
jgi:hypothetical protein